MPANLPTKESKLPPTEEKALAILSGMVDADGNSVPVKDWKKASAAMGQISSHDDYKQRHKAVTRAITNLVARGLVRIEGEKASERASLAGADFEEIDEDE